jgi:RIO kinase 1
MVFRAVMRNIEAMLANGRIHSDLSAYNILYWQGEIRIIDFPQAVDPRVNPHARALLLRDVGNMCRWSGKQGFHQDANRLADALWRRFMRGELQ